MQNLDPLSTLPLATITSRRLRVAATLGGAALLLGAVGITFWTQDIRYSLPTPRPPTLADVPTGATVALPGPFDRTAMSNDDRPLFLHFFNPDCPCSRFNAEHIRSLIVRFGRQARFIAVIQSVDTPDAAQRQENLAAAAKLFGPGMEAVVDDGGKIAAACGVYSTPQAVILTAGASHALLFRGNYNASRYCADPQTEFARLALTAVISHRSLPPESRAAMIAYGCELPANAPAKAPL